MSAKDRPIPLRALRRKGVSLSLTSDFPDAGWTTAGALELRGPADVELLPATPPVAGADALLLQAGCLLVEAGRDYFVFRETGPLAEASLGGAGAAVTVLGRKGTDGWLNFGSRVGRSDFCGLAVEVREPRFGPGAYDAMLRDVTEAASQLLFDCEGPSGVGLSKRRIRQQEALYPLFRFLRYAMREAPPDERIGGCFAEIVRYPHNRTFRRREWASVHGGRDVLPVTMIGLACRPECLTVLADESPLRESAIGRRLGRFGRAFFPERILTERILTTFDTQENRFVKHFIALLQDIVEAVSSAFAREAVGAQNRLEATRMLGEVRRMKKADFLKGVGELSRMPGESQVLRKRAGYRELTRLYHLLFLASQMGWDDLVHIENRRLDVLYEYWCFFRILDLMRDLYGSRRPVKVGALEPVKAGLLLDLSREGSLTVTFSGAAGRLQRGALTFCRPYRAGQGSYSIDLRAGITVQAGSGRTLALRVAYGSGPKGGGAGQLRDTLAELHALRDATPCVAALRLQPCAEAVFYRAKGAFAGFDALSRADLDGVGIVPMAPGSPGDAVRLAQVLAAFLAA